MNEATQAAEKSRPGCYGNPYAFCEHPSYCEHFKACNKEYRKRIDFIAEGWAIDSKPNHGGA